MTMGEAVNTEVKEPILESNSNERLKLDDAGDKVDLGEQVEFWNVETQSWNVDKLLKSHSELQSKLEQVARASNSDTIDNPSQEATTSEHDAKSEMNSGQNFPENPLLQAIEAKIDDLGLDQSQNGQVLDLVHECFEYGQSFLDQQLQAGRELARLEAHFGGSAPWSKICKEMESWAKKNLDGQLYESLSSSYDGIIKMHEMMQSNEPQTIGRPDGLTNELSEEKLFDLMRDPRYWRDHDPTIVETVTFGFKQIYGA